MEINKPQIKVDTVDYDGTGGRVLLLMDLDQEDPTFQIKLTILKIKERFVESSSTVKLIDREPVVFHIDNGEEIYRFTISFPLHLKHIQADLIMGIEKLGNTP